MQSKTTRSNNNIPLWFGESSAEAKYRFLIVNRKECESLKFIGLLADEMTLRKFCYQNFTKKTYDVNIISIDSRMFLTLNVSLILIDLPYSQYLKIKIPTLNISIFDTIILSVTFLPFNDECKLYNQYLLNPFLPVVSFFGILLREAQYLSQTIIFDQKPWVLEK